MRWRAIWCAVFLILGSAQGRVLFWDDFERDPLGAEPSQWKAVDDPPGGPPGEVARDPENPDNKVFLTSLRGDRNGKVYVVGEKSWTDIVVRFDWYLAREGIQHGTVFRYQDRDNHYLIDRRSPAAGNAMDFWRRQNGVWTNIGRTPMTVAVKVWYTTLLILEGDTFTAKMKERDDPTPFSKLDPVLKAQDGAFATGYFGTYGSEEIGVAYYDNVIVGESEAEVEAASRAVRAQGKLPLLWGALKGAGVGLAR